ncbi:NAD/FAD-utilizing enzyme [Ectothiorhodospiraceae bacterium WFHF3C12]|nr:NAD/FAD-utilizing enzyme [Ectothiorhodospiraceae bacterium WFHF3C12]
MKRRFFISDDLDDLERLEEDLEQAGIVTPQIHVLTLDDTGLEGHQHLNAVVSLMRRDVVHSTLIGAAVGVFAAIIVLALSYLFGWTDTAAGWTPFIFLSIIMLGFFTWEGGLRGMEEPNVHFRNFEKVLKEGRHVFFVDLDPGQEYVLDQITPYHNSIEPAGSDRGSPHWIVHLQHSVRRFFVEVFP